MDTDRNLLFAVLALQADLLDKARFVEACTLWASQKQTPLPDLLVGRGWLTPEDRRDVEKLLQRKLARHGGDARASLAEVAGDQVRHSLAGVDDEELWRTLATPATPGPVLLSTGFHLPQSRERYTLSRLHATGGIGRVWLARDDTLGRDVALKELRPERVANPSVWGRFLKEAQVTGQLEHPGIVPIYGVGRRPEDQAPFYTMRFVRGPTLAEAAAAYHARKRRGEEGPLELRELLSRFVGVCETVAYAHSRGVLHRDLKPQNVVLGDFGEVIVLDWGLAKVLGGADGEGAPAAPVTLPGEGSRDETVAGQVLGTPAYMAPEQAEGRLDLLDARTDVYGLGAVLYHVLAGRPPFAGQDTTAVLRQVVHEPPAPVAVLGAAKPLGAVCLKALAKRPSERYASAKELADEVRHWLADEPVVAYREPPAARLGRWARRNRPLVAGAVAAAVVLAVGGAAFGVHRVREQERHRYEAALREEEARRRADRLRNEAEGRLAVGLGLARDGDIEGAIHSLAATVGFCRQSEELSAQHDKGAGYLREMERYRTFRAKAAAVLRQGVHNIRSQQKPDPLVRQCEEALAVYGVTTAPGWRGPTDAALSPRQAGEVRRLAHYLLVFAAIRLAMFDTRDEEAKANTRRGLALLDRAARLQTPGVGVWMLRMFWNRRLKDNAAADHAGQMMTRAAKEGRLKTALDYYLLGSVTLHVLKDPKRAADHYRAVLRLEPNHYGANFGLYLCHYQQNDARGELVPLTSCLVLRPDEADLYHFRGYAHFRLAEYVAAYHYFDAAVARDSRHAKGLYWRGRALVMASRWAEAERDFGRAVEADPALRQALYWRAVARGKVGRHADAAADAERSVKEDPDHPDTLFYAARAYAVAVKAAGADEAVAKRYGDRSVALLGRALERGFRDASRFHPKGDFGPLYDRADFQKLLDRLRSLAPAKKGKAAGPVTRAVQPDQLTTAPVG